MIPANQIDRRAYATLMEYLRYEIPKALSDRNPLEDRWVKYQIGYRAMPETEQKDFPFIGAANLVLPIIATDVDTVYSRLMGILFTPDNFWACKPLNEEMVDFAPRLQEFLQWAQDAELGVYPAAGDFIMELCKLGTGIIKTRYTREQKRVYQFRETDQGTIEQVLSMLIKDHPVVEHVSLFDYLVPASANATTTSPWASERLSLIYGQIQNRIRAGIYTGGERLSRWHAVEKGGKIVETMQTLDAFQPGIGDKFELWETWLDYDIAALGEPQAIVATIHLPTNTCLRVDYNPFFNQEKPFSEARYLRQEKRFYGIGLCEMLEQFQDEVSTMHNQRLDNATLANSSMFWALKGQGIRENEPVIPGRWFIVDNKDALGVLPMGERYDSTVPYEELTVGYARSRTGVNDYISAESSTSANYSTATTAVQMLREGSKRFDQILRECRRCWGDVGVKVVELYQQYNQNGKEYLVLGQKDGAMVHQVLQFPLELIRTSIGIELTATSAQLNKEVEIRTNQIIMGLLTQYYTQIMQAMSYVVNPQIPPEIQHLAYQMIDGGTVLMRQILDNFGKQDIDRLIPDLQAAMNHGQQQLDTAQRALQSGQGIPPSLAGASGVVSPMFGGAGVPGIGQQQPAA